MNALIRWSINILYVEHILQKHFTQRKKCTRGACAGTWYDTYEVHTTRLEKYVQKHRINLVRFHAPPNLRHQVPGTYNTSYMVHTLRRSTIEVHPNFF